MAYLGCHLYNENNDDIIKPATDVFEINDFTAATEWENFIDDIENILRKSPVLNNNFVEEEIIVHVKYVKETSGLNIIVDSSALLSIVSDKWLKN